MMMQEDGGEASVLEEKTLDFVRETQQVHEHRQYVKLNVGGSLYTTTLTTLTNTDGHMLASMFSGRLPVDADNEGWVLLDRDGEMFAYILNYLRDPTCPLPSSQERLSRLMKEAEYFLLEGLQNRIADQLQTHHIASCVVPVIVSEEEEARLIQATTKGKPLVKLAYNRSNNRFSYTQPSTTSLFQHIELFDKLSTKFRGRVIYARDVSGRNGHICTWSFFGKGRLLAEINCTSMVYAADKKQTKIEFPEARLYEENMNILLYEPGQKNPPPLPQDSIDGQDLFPNLTTSTTTTTTTSTTPTTVA